MHAEVYAGFVTRGSLFFYSDKSTQLPKLLIGRRSDMIITPWYIYPLNTSAVHLYGQIGIQLRFAKSTTGTSAGSVNNFSLGLCSLGDFNH